MSILQPILVEKKTQKRHIHRSKKLTGKQVRLDNAWSIEEEEAFKVLVAQIKETARTRYVLDHVDVAITALHLGRYMDHYLTIEWWWAGFWDCNECKDEDEEERDCKNCLYEGSPNCWDYDFSDEKQAQKFVRARIKWAKPIVEAQWDSLMFSLREVTRKRFWKQ